MKIQDILRDADRKIYYRGQEYYEEERVFDFVQKNECCTACVEGQYEEFYDVEITLDQRGEIRDWSCDCPYDGGPICKHVIAVLLAMENGDVEVTELKEAGGPAADSLKELLKKADRKTLEELILQWSGQDQRLYLDAMCKLGISVQKECDLLKREIESVIRDNTDEWNGCACEEDFDEILLAIDEAVEKAAEWSEKGELLPEVEFLIWLMGKTVELIEEDDGMVDATWDKILNESCRCLEKLRGQGTEQEKQTAFAELIGMIREDVMPGNEYWGYQALGAAARIAEGSRRLRLQEYLEENREIYGENRMEKQVWYDMLRFTDTEESAEAYLMKHLEIESFRRIAVETALRREQYETAEKLCREFLDQHTPSVTGGLWERWLLQIYILWGNKEKQVRQLWKLYTLGDSAYWGELKTVLQEQGSWEKAYPILLIEARKTLSVSEYSALLAEENEVDLLMELVRQEPQRCIRFAEKLFPAYRIEICLLCTEELLHLSQEACNRKEYAAVCSQVEALYRIGAKEEMMDLIARLKAAYPRRPAFQDELNRLESRL